MYHHKEITAKNLVEMIAYVENFHIPNESENEMKENRPPLYYRLQMIRSLSKVFQLAENLEEIIDGEWLEELDDESKDLAQKAINHHLSQNKNSHIHHKIGIDEDSFNSLMQYRIDLQKGLEGLSNPGASEGVFELVDHFAHQLQGFSNLLTEILAIMIDPLQRTFTVKQLIDEYHFPDVDLVEVDSEY